MGVLKRPTPEEMTELKRLRGSTKVVGFLQSSLDETKTSLVATPDTRSTILLQGHAQALTELLKFITQ